MTTGFVWTVKVDGTDVAGYVFEGGQIAYGRQTAGEQPNIGYAVLELMTEDFYPQFGTDYPEFGLGEHSMPTGYVDTYAATYAGPSSRLTIGAPVTVQADSIESGYADTYTDTYYGDANRRFTGYIVALDYEWDRIRITAVAPMEAMARILTGDTQTAGTEWASESDVARAARIWPTITIQQGTTVNVVERAGMRAESSLALIQELASSCEALAYCDRLGTITYRSRDYGTPRSYTIPGDLVRRDDLRMSLDIGELNNNIILEYGTNQPKDQVTATDSASVTQYGQRDGNFSTILADTAAAQAYADRELTRRAAGWKMPELTIDFMLATTTQIANIAALDLGDQITVPTMLDGAPVTSYTAEVLGYTESLSIAEWTLNFHLAPAGTLTP